MNEITVYRSDALIGFGEAHEAKLHLHPTGCSTAEGERAHKVSDHVRYVVFFNAAQYN